MKSIEFSGLMIIFCVAACLLTPTGLRAELIPINDAPGINEEWVFTPGDGQLSPTNPPAFVWRPQNGAVKYEFQCSSEKDFKKIEYSAADIKFNTLCPNRVFPLGRWYWRYRFCNSKGTYSSWSKVRSFLLDKTSVEFVVPSNDELKKRVPKQHPRILVRPEQLDKIRKDAANERKQEFQKLLKHCDKILANMPSTEEPPKYGNVKSRSEEWRKIWWGNRKLTVKVLDSAAQLGFAWLVSGQEKYGEAAKKLLMAAAEWDPKGSTGYRYNDEAGMPYGYYFARTYTFIYPLLSEAERAKCLNVMRIRGQEMYKHLFPRMLWRPYGSHSNRAWHFLAEIALACYGDVPEAENWLEFAMNYFYCIYPVWSDSDGGWHEGMAYWNSYITRFTWWAETMQNVLGVDPYKKPYFAQAGYLPMYLMPPGTAGGGFGDCTGDRNSRSNVNLMRILAAQSGNPAWQWYVDAHKPGKSSSVHYVDYLRNGQLPEKSELPENFPDSIVFRGTGVAILNSDVTDAGKNVQIIFKSSPFGATSHGYDAQNSFLLYAFGQRLLIRSGKRDIYGSPHHRNWMWETKSVNSITVDGKGQIPHSNQAKGRITGFFTSDKMDFVAGQAAAAYPDGLLKSFARNIIFFKPGVIVIVDGLEAPQPATFQWYLHAQKQFIIADNTASAEYSGASCKVTFITPSNLKISQTDAFDPPPSERVKLKQWHLTADTLQKSAKMTFVTLIQVYKTGAKLPEVSFSDNGGKPCIYSKDFSITIDSADKFNAEVGNKKFTIENAEVRER
jgi:hypothetical protein